jgi:hypothetical protein
MKRLFRKKINIQADVFDPQDLEEERYCASAAEVGRVPLVNCQRLVVTSSHCP